jgi:hypothetical protein
MATSQTLTPSHSWKTLGYFTVAVGVLVPLVNAGLVGLGIARFQEMGLSAHAIAPLWLSMAVYIGVGLVLVLAGLGLSQSASWARLVSLLGAALLFLAVPVAALFMSMAWGRADQEYRGPLTEVWLMAGFPALWPGYGVVLLVLLNLPPTRESEPRVSTWAVVTFILSLTPLGGFTQLAAVVTGLVALVKIGRSRGALLGTALTIAGMSVAVLILAGCVIWLVASQWATGSAASSMYLTAAGGLISLALVPFLIGGRRSPSGTVGPSGDREAIRTEQVAQPGR